MGNTCGVAWGRFGGGVGGEGVVGSEGIDLGQHTAGAAGAVVEQIGAGSDLVGDGQEDESGP